MANSGGNLDPWAVTRDLIAGIGNSAIDSRYGVGGLAHPPAGGSPYGFGDGVFPSYMLGSSIGDLKVNPVTPTPGMAATVAAGNAQIYRTNNGPYLGATSTSQTVTFAAADATNPRKDLVIIRTQDPGVDSGPTQSWFPFVLTGAPSASPVPPTGQLLDTDITLAIVTVRANANQVLGSDIVDARFYATARGGIVPASGSDTRSGSYPGHYRDNQATAALERWNGSAWIPVASGAGWSSFTPTLRYGGDGYTNSPGTAIANLGTGSISSGRWFVSGKAITLSYTFQWGARPYNMGVGDISTTLPPGWVQTPNGHAILSCGLGVDNEFPNGFNPFYKGIAFLYPNSNVVWIMFDQNLSYATINGQTTYYVPGVNYYRAATQAGVPGGGIPFVPTGFPQGGSLTITGTLEVA